MPRPAHSLLLVLVTGILVSGCATPIALRRQTVQQGNTVADLHQQQVLDNLAKFICDPYAIPSFALADAGTTEVIDTKSGSFFVNWIRSGFDLARISGEASRRNRSLWTTKPITDPRKLELMRCAYQRVLTRCGCCPAESTSCPDCTKRFNKFYTGRESDSDNSGDDDSRPGKLLVTSECLTCENGQWFCWSRRKRRIPKHCGYVGHHNGLYVWVPSGSGRNELAILTLAILDYAIHDDRKLPPARTKEVVAYMKRDGSAATEENAELVVKSVVGFGDPSVTVLSSDLGYQSRRREKRNELEMRENDLLKQGKGRGIDVKSIESLQSIMAKQQRQMMLAPNATDEEQNKFAERMRDLQEFNRVLQKFTKEQRELAELPQPAPQEPLPQTRTPAPSGGLLLLEQRLETVR